MSKPWPLFVPWNLQWTQFARQPVCFPDQVCCIYAWEFSICRDWECRIPCWCGLWQQRGWRRRQPSPSPHVGHSFAEALLLPHAQVCYASIFCCLLIISMNILSSTDEMICWMQWAGCPPITERWGCKVHHWKRVIPQPNHSKHYRLSLFGLRFSNNDLLALLIMLAFLSYLFLFSFYFCCLCLTGIQEAKKSDGGI